MKGLAAAPLVTAMLVVLVGVPSHSQPAAPAAVVVPRPPFAYFGPGSAAATTRVRLVKLTEARNRITDVEEWFAANDLSLPVVPRSALPAGVPTTYAGSRLVEAISDGELLLLLYGPDVSAMRYLVGYDRRAGRVAFALDFGAYLVPPAYVREDRAFVDEGLRWAQVREGVLYVSNFHMTYARSSGGRNGYLTALDPATGRLRWRSRPLVANSRAFAVVADAIITGYGFTAEPDYLYVLDRGSGAVRQRIGLRSAPEHIVVRGDRVFVRAYDTNYLFRITR